MKAAVAEGCSMLFLPECFSFIGRSPAEVKAHVPLAACNHTRLMSFQVCFLITLFCKSVKLHVPWGLVHRPPCKRLQSDKKVTCPHINHSHADDHACKYLITLHCITAYCASKILVFTSTCTMSLHQDNCLLRSQLLLPRPWMDQSCSVTLS